MRNKTKLKAIEDFNNGKISRRYHDYYHELFPLKEDDFRNGKMDAQRDSDSFRRGRNIAIRKINGNMICLTIALRDIFSEVLDKLRASTVYIKIRSFYNELPEPQNRVFTSEIWSIRRSMLIRIENELNGDGARGERRKIRKYFIELFKDLERARLGDRHG